MIPTMNRIGIASNTSSNMIILSDIDGALSGAVGSDPGGGGSDLPSVPKSGSVVGSGDRDCSDLSSVPKSCSGIL